MVGGGVETVAAADELMETNNEPDLVIGIKRDRPVTRKASPAASQKILYLTSPTKYTVLLREDDAIFTGSCNKKRKRADVVPHVKVVPCVKIILGSGRYREGGYQKCEETTR